MADGDLAIGALVSTPLHPLGTPHDEVGRIMVVARVVGVTPGRPPYGRETSKVYGPTTVWVEIEGARLGRVPRALAHVELVGNGFNRSRD